MFNYKKVAKLKARILELENLFQEGTNVVTREDEVGGGFYLPTTMWSTPSDRFKNLIAAISDRRKEKNRIEEIQNIVRETYEECKGENHGGYKRSDS